MGWAGSLCFLICLIRTVRAGPDSGLPNAAGPDANPPLPLAGRRFWLAFVVIGIPLNILPVRVYDFQGLAHVNLQPFVCLAVVWFVRELGSLPKVWKAILGAVFTAESLFTSGVLVYLQMREVPVRALPGGRFASSADLLLNARYVENYVLKLQYAAVFLSDRLGDRAVAASLVAAGMAFGLLLWLYRGVRANRPAARDLYRGARPKGDSGSLWKRLGGG